MNSAFRELHPAQKLVPVTFDGSDLMLPAGANLAAALLVAGVEVLRATPVSGASRAPYCMMGACFDCLIEISGVTQQACMMQVSEGMVIGKAKGRTHAAG